jgi:leader peptidase (prepilin peptidase)/N-methyltransferase
VLLILAAAVLGAVIGSFLGAALVRLPDGRSVLAGRSSCDACGKDLTPVELVPVVSWLIQRGVCRSCGAGIGGWQLAAEVGGAVIAALAAALSVFPLAAMVLGWQLLLLALLDLQHMWLPRVLTLLLAASGIMFMTLWAYQGRDAMILVEALVGGAFGFVTLWLLAQGYERLRGREGLGGGDPPLLGAIGLWLGPLGVIHTLLLASLGGLAVAGVMHAMGRRIAPDTALPLGTLLAAAAWPVFVWQGMVWGLV